MLLGAGHLHVQIILMAVVDNSAAAVQAIVGRLPIVAVRILAVRLIVGTVPIQAADRATNRELYT